MVGAKTATGVNITYTFVYGCANTFAIAITQGADEAPGNVTKYDGECSYHTKWAAPLAPPPPPPPAYRCINGTCVPGLPGLAGLTNFSCTQNCGPLTY
jgi:hypothetical protein